MINANVQRRQRIVLIIGLAVTIAALWFSFRETDLASVWQSFRLADWRYAPLVLATYGGGFIIRAHRWRLLMRPIRDIVTSRTYGPMMLGFFANNILPARLGEFVRMHLGARRFGMYNSTVLATLVVERLFDFLVVVVILWVALIMTDRVPQGLVEAGNIIGMIAALGLLGLAAFAHWTGFFLRLARKLAFVLPERVRPFVRQQLELVAIGCEAIKQPRLLMLIMIESLLIWLLAGFAIWWSLFALDVTIPLAAAFVVLLASVLAVALPSSPGFFGAVQLAFILALNPFGVPAADALAASFFFHILSYTLVTVWGFYFMRDLDYNLGSLRREASAD